MLVMLLLLFSHEGIAAVQLVVTAQAPINLEWKVRLKVRMYPGMTLLLHVLCALCSNTTAVCAICSI